MNVTLFFERLAQKHPNPTTELHYNSPFELLVAVVLSAQATDKKVNEVTDTLFPVANTPDSVCKMGEEKLKFYLKSINYYITKAKHIVQLSRLLIEKHHGEVPDSREALEALPGVGRKTANVVLNVVFGHPTIAVDTHIFRVANRTGLAKGKTPLAVEQQLLKKIPERFLPYAHYWLILHGRYVCLARKPHCPSCILQDLCQFPKKTSILNS